MAFKDPEIREVLARVRGIEEYQHIKVVHRSLDWWIKRLKMP